MIRVQRGMTVDQVRTIWALRTAAKTKAIMDKYRAFRQNSGSGGREGLGVYGMYQTRITREKVRLAASLLEKAGLEVSCGSIRKVTGQSTATIAGYWDPPQRDLPVDAPAETAPIEEDPPPRNFPFPRREGLDNGRRLT